MTFGQKIKKLRSDANLTQKDLAEKMNVTFQTVSKWESDLNEPDMATIKELSKVFGCSIEYLFSEDEQNDEDNSAVIVPPITPIKITECEDCGEEIKDELSLHKVKRKNADGNIIEVSICDSCFQKQKAEEEKKVEEIYSDLDDNKKVTKKGKKSSILQRKDKVPLIWGIIVGAVAAIVTLVLCLVFYNNVGLTLTIVLPIAIGYTLLADIYCIFTVSYISDVFLEVASWSIRFPGIIFSFDLEGLMFLIVMKILFFILGIMISISVFLLALAISSLLAVFSFIPILIYNTKHY